VKVAVNSLNSALGFAWVTLPDAASAQQALKERNGHTMRIFATRDSFEDVKLQVSFPIGPVDRLFCDLSHDVRRRIQLDDVACYSVTEMRSADKISRLLVSMAKCGQASSLCHLSICDAFACIGGNTLSFAKSFDRVDAIELDTGRYEMLAKNVNDVWQEWTAGKVNPLHADCFDVLLHSEKRFDLVFLDPPWGGTDYSEQDIVSDYSISGIVMHDVLRQLRFRCKMVALRLPLNYDIASLAASMVDPEMENESGHRPLPFQVKLGAKTVLLIIAFPEYRTSSARSNLSFGDQRLDDLVAAARKFDKSVLKKKGKAKFWDFEASGGKGDWIRLGAWHGL